MSVVGYGYHGEDEGGLPALGDQTSFENRESA